MEKAYYIAYGVSNIDDQLYCVVRRFKRDGLEWQDIVHRFGDKVNNSWFISDISKTEYEMIRKNKQYQYFQNQYKLTNTFK